MNLDTASSVAQIAGVLILIPGALWKGWQKISERLNQQDDRLIRIEAQFHRNGGSTLRDSIDRMDRDLAKLTGRFDQHIEENY